MYTLTSKLKQNFRNENQAGPTLPFAKISGIISDFTRCSAIGQFFLCPQKPFQESSPRKHLSSSLKSLTLGTSQSRHRGVYANLLTSYVNLLI